MEQPHEKTPRYCGTGFTEAVFLQSGLIAKMPGLTPLVNVMDTFHCY
jgi:hypothetical protein